jgi:signal transduction histidine kinase
MMLRRKLVVLFGSLVILLLATAIGAIWMLQDVLTRLRHLDTQAWAVIEDTNKLAASISVVEIQLYELELGRQRHLDKLIDTLQSIENLVDTVSTSYVTQIPENTSLMKRIREGLPKFTAGVASLGTAQDPIFAATHRREAVTAAVALRQDILQLSRSVAAHGEAEQTALTTRFRWIVMGLTAIFLVLINVSIIALLRMAGMILRPVEKLVEATRELGRERFDYRVEIDQKDEFDELATAYNSLAGQLQSNEQRKLEMLGQVALTLNHELNNAAAIIELQLQLLGRQTGGNASLGKYAQQIRDSLHRMTRTVELLKHVRRIVLTDYISGVKMLDLERSVSIDDDPEIAPANTGIQTQRVL